MKFALMSCVLMLSMMSWQSASAADSETHLYCMKENGRMMYNLHTTVLVTTMDEKGTPGWFISPNTGAVEVTWYKEGTFLSGSGRVICENNPLQAGASVRCRGLWGDFGSHSDDLDVVISVSSDGVFSAVLNPKGSTGGIPMTCGLSKE